MIMVPDRAERSVDVADVGVVENGGPADLFVNGIDHVHCAYLYSPGPSFRLTGDLFAGSHVTDGRDEGRARDMR
ncbi:hypothetical protein JQ554_06895 [Bradyrhizobium diazoefficiens]|nr:hypothetical protein [Bradyrhizobium diazoefficiens]MBR0963822.1 hypothetical protein [Bradyrhizobium diazoefficiens]MBR0977973.1 hypothetical protein [Bradyrhizobium diazoefficiens]MBR1012675.1 hypothetical protein [Bradyrhizobium diazoefficiens]MBR1051570.1 hypothetical protein [Bradyrhizobium diazoefficiens]MBR1114701.1 hypothetical protein [Bradyrhizobium diazoefficiens]